MYHCKKTIYFSKEFRQGFDHTAQENQAPPFETCTSTICNLIILLKQCLSYSPSNSISCLYKPRLSHGCLLKLSWEMSPHSYFLEQFSNWHYPLCVVMSTIKKDYNFYLNYRIQIKSPNYTDCYWMGGVGWRVGKKKKERAFDPLNFHLLVILLPHTLSRLDTLISQHIIVQIMWNHVKKLAPVGWKTDST